MKQTLLISIVLVSWVCTSAQDTGNTNVTGSVDVEIHLPPNMQQVKGPKIQVLTPCLAEHGDGGFYNKYTHKYTYVDRYDIVRYHYCFTNGSFTFNYERSTEGLQLAFQLPYAKNAMIRVVGAGNKVQLEGKLGTMTRIFGSTTVTKDKGYVICKGHADNQGRLFLTMNSQVDKKHRGGRLYTFLKTNATLIKQYKHDVGDFAWDFNNTKFYLVTNGKNITQYNYKNGTLSDEKVIFKLPISFIKQEIITGIETDKKGRIWATVFGGYLLKIHKNKGIWTICQVTMLPAHHPTGLTFGGFNCNALLITTSKTCSGRQFDAGSSLYVSGLNTTGICDNLVNG